MISHMVQGGKFGVRARIRALKALGVPFMARAKMAKALNKGAPDRILAVAAKFPEAFQTGTAPCACGQCRDPLPMIKTSSGELIYGNGIAGAFAPV